MKPEHEQALRELREHQAKRKAEMLAAGIPVPADPPAQYPTAENPGQVVIKFVAKAIDLPDRVQDFDFEGSRSELRQELECDAFENKCRFFVVFDEGGQFAVWRQKD